MQNSFLKLLQSFMIFACSFFSLSFAFSQEIISFPVHGTLIHLRKTEVSVNHYNLELEVAKNRFVSLGIFIDENAASEPRVFQNPQGKFYTKVSKEEIALRDHLLGMDRTSRMSDPVSKALFLSGFGLSIIREFEIVIYPHALYFNFLDLNTSRAFNFPSCRDHLSTL